MLSSRRNDEGLGPPKELLRFAGCGTLWAAVFRNSNRPPPTWRQAEAAATRTGASADGFSL
jgi:hypothetical protein